MSIQKNRHVSGPHTQNTVKLKYVIVNMQTKRQIKQKTTTAPSANHDK